MDLEFAGDWHAGFVEVNTYPTELAAIAEFFDIGTVNQVSCLDGVANDNYSVSTSSGRFVVKLVREHSAENLKTIGPIFQMLEKHGFPAAYYLKNSNEAFVFDNDGVVAVVMHCEAGANPAVTEESMYVMGKHLARLHAVPVESQVVRSTWFHPNFLTQGIADLTARYGSATMERFQVAAGQIKSMESLKLRRSIIHGDYHPGNVLFHNNTLSTVLDWEEASYGYSLVDIAYALFILCFDDSTFDVEWYMSFLNGYQSERPLLQSEWDGLPTVVRFVGLTVATWISLRYGAKRSDPTLEALATRYWAADLARWEAPPLT